MPEEVLFETERTETRASVAATLRTVADKLESGEDLHFSAGDQSVTVAVPSRPTFEVKVERETASGGGAGELSVEFELEWDEGAGEGEGDGRLSIE